MTWKSTMGSHHSFPLLEQSTLLDCIIVISSRMLCVSKKEINKKIDQNSSEINQLHYSSQGKKREVKNSLV